jgi:hypothetical protein
MKSEYLRLTARFSAARRLRGRWCRAARWRASHMRSMLRLRRAAWTGSAGPPGPQPANL